MCCTCASASARDNFISCMVFSLCLYFFSVFWSFTFYVWNERKKTATISCQYMYDAGTLYFVCLFVCSSHSSNIFVWPKIMLSIRIRQEERNKLKNRKNSKNKFFADFLFENKSNKRTSVVCTEFIDYFLDWFRGAVVIATFPFQSSSFTVSSFLSLSLSHLNHVHRLLLSSHIANER